MGPLEIVFAFLFASLIVKSLAVPALGLMRRLVEAWAKRIEQPPSDAALRADVQRLTESLEALHEQVHEIRQQQRFLEGLLERRNEPALPASRRE
ncbi:MAG: hypothetical protein HY703_02945 [Gemmatimonadetes bacterium]|nr:hypothetical protein [Gemmatimonadota bacterium]